jgi:serine/threonine protein kinase
VELKYYSGTLRGDDLRWIRDGHRAEDSPLLLARRKAQRLRSKLCDEFARWAREHGQQVPDPRKVIPYVQECVFLHHPGLRCALPASSRIDLFGLDGDAGRRCGLPGISERLLEPPTPHQSVPARTDQHLVALLEHIGVVQRRHREAGSWIIDEEPLAEGDGWQDWPAFHKVAGDQRGRIRFHVTAPGAASEETTRVRRIAEHEYRVMSRLAHDGLLRPRDLVDAELGVGLVYPDDDRYQRLDLWLAEQPGGIPVADQLAIVRQVAEAVGYAHGNRVVHRGLTPNAVRVHRLDNGGLRVLVGDWQSSGSSGAPGRGSSPAGVTGLLGVTEQASAAAERLATALRPPVQDADRRAAEAFQAPEGLWSPGADRVRLDVFALGALTYYLFAGRPPASDRPGLRERLHRDGGLDLAADLPQVPSAVRDLVLAATKPAVTKRLPDVGAFLALLAGAERFLGSALEESADPLEALPGAVLAGRFELVRRLGAGSTAVGLLVTDLVVEGGGWEAERVLKVAVDDAAAERLVGEAAVLAGLRGPRLVRMIEGPVEVGPRTALLLASAGTETLGDALKARTRLSLDLLERWGTDLLEALVALDRAGVNHRDIKPANLGVREGRGDRVKHMVLFDFSLSRAAATALSAGTPPYLDPFLDARGTYDSAAERYAAAVVLFEMASGGTPVYCDPLTDPASVPDEATVTPELFDASVAAALVPFFRTALARDVAARHDTAAQMLAAWRTAFAPVPKTVPDDADERAEAAQPSTPLTEAGLSARALSALEPLGVGTVGDVAALDPVRLARLSGVAEPTRREVRERARRWRERFAGTAPGGAAGQPGGTAGQHSTDGLPDPVAAAALLLASCGSTRAQSRRATARLLLGVDPGLDAFASQAELGAALNVTRGRASQQVTALQAAWAADTASRDLLDLLNGTARQALADLGGVATVDELAAAILTTTPQPAGDGGTGNGGAGHHSAGGGTGDRSASGRAGDRSAGDGAGDRSASGGTGDRSAGHGVGDRGPGDRAAGSGTGSSEGRDRVAGGGATGDPPRQRIAAGLLRLALDRGEALGRAEADEAPLSSRRRGGRIAVLAVDASLLDAADALGQTADRLLAEARAVGEHIVAPRRAVPELRAVCTRLAGDAPAALPSTEPAADARLLRLAVALSVGAALSGSDELYDRDLDLRLAVTVALKGVGSGQPVVAQEVRDRVRARFPGLPPLPDRPRLDRLLADAGLNLVYDEAMRAYRSPTRAGETTGLESRVATRHAVPEAPLVAGGRIGHRLAESARARSFLALGVDARLADRAVAVLARVQGATVLDLTSVLIEAMRTEAAAVGLGWDAVRAADAATAGTREAQGLAALVRKALPALDAAIEAATGSATESATGSITGSAAEAGSGATAGSGPGGAAGAGSARAVDRPVLLTEAGPLARYDALGTLTRWTDLASRRTQAVWLLVPQLMGNQGALIDGRPLPLAAPGQFFKLDADWLDAHSAAPAAAPAAEGAP